MPDRAYWRLTDMKAAITDIRQLLRGKTVEYLRTDRPTRAAYERFLEILSEASRQLPEDWKHAFPEVPWRQVADLGNFIRHAYHKIDLDVLWAIYTDDLDRVESAVDRLLQRTRAPRPDL